MKHAIPAVGAAVLAATSIPAQPAELRETVTSVFERPVANIEGKSLIALEVMYPPGAASASHSHPRSAFIYAYVLSGEIVSAVDDEKPRIYRTGEGWHELPGAHHRVSRNASTTKPAKLLAVFIVDTNERQLVTADRK